jgi:hypothetical protein
VLFGVEELLHAEIMEPCNQISKCVQEKTDGQVKGAKREKKARLALFS